MSNFPGQINPSGQQWNQPRGRGFAGSPQQRRQGPGGILDNVPQSGRGSSRPGRGRGGGRHDGNRGRGGRGRGGDGGGGQGLLETSGAARNSGPLLQTSAGGQQPWASSGPSAFPLPAPRSGGHAVLGSLLSNPPSALPPPYMSASGPPQPPPPTNRPFAKNPPVMSQPSNFGGGGGVFSGSAPEAPQRPAAKGWFSKAPAAPLQAKGPAPTTPFSSSFAAAASTGATGAPVAPPPPPPQSSFRSAFATAPPATAPHVQNAVAATRADNSSKMPPLSVTQDRREEWTSHVPDENDGDEAATGSFDDEDRDRDSESNGNGSEHTDYDDMGTEGSGGDSNRESSGDNPFSSADGFYDSQDDNEADPREGGSGHSLTAAPPKEPQETSRGGGGGDSGVFSAFGGGLGNASSTSGNFPSIAPQPAKAGSAFSTLAGSSLPAQVSSPFGNTVTTGHVSAFARPPSQPTPKAVPAKREREEEIQVPMSDRTAFGNFSAAPPPPFTAPNRAHVPARALSATGTTTTHVPNVRDHKVDMTHLTKSGKMFQTFLHCIADDKRREDAWRSLDAAFFGNPVGSAADGSSDSSPDFSYTVAELNGVWGKARENTPALRRENMRGPMWVAFFALGCQVNLVMRAIAERDNPDAYSHDSPGATLSGRSASYKAFVAGVVSNVRLALDDVGNFARQMNDLAVELFQHQADMLVPYSILPTILARTRTAFAEASVYGTFSVITDMRSTTSKIYAALSKPLRTTLTKFDGNPSYDMTCSERHLMTSFASLAYEMRMCEAPRSSDLDKLITVFHSIFWAYYEQRCMIYYSEAMFFMQQPQTTDTLHMAAKNLASAAMVLPEGGHGAQRANSGTSGGDAHSDAAYVTRVNKRMLFIALTAVNLALGKVPRSEDIASFNVPELENAITALRAANLPFFDEALRTNAVFFLQAKIYNIMMAARQRLCLFLVIKFYVANKCNNKITVQDLVEHYKMPYSVEEALTVWLLPLLINMSINGVIDQNTLVLSRKDPFQGIDPARLEQVAAEEYGGGYDTTAAAS